MVLHGSANKESLRPDVRRPTYVIEPAFITSTIVEQKRPESEL